MSEEAKQAAEGLLTEGLIGVGSYSSMADYTAKTEKLIIDVAKVIDAATAKLDAEWRERVKKLETIHNKFCVEEKAKLREELAQAIESRDSWLEIANAIANHKLSPVGPGQTTEKEQLKNE